MLSKLLTFLQSSADEEIAPKKKSGRYDIERLRKLVEYFPIGRKLRYFPETHRDVALSTMVIGYRVDDHYIYTKESVVLESADDTHGFRIGTKRLVETDDIERFYILVTDTSHMTRKLDYLTRAEMGKAGPFKHGNMITLMAEGSKRSIPTMETEVYRRFELRDGPYANSDVVLLIPDFSSITITDKRKQQRIEAGIHASLLHGREGRSVTYCALKDFSEVSLRLGVGEENEPLPNLQMGETVSVKFFLGDSGMPYCLQGKILRQDEDDCVVRILHIYDDGGFRSMTSADVAEVKTLLLNAAG